MARTFQCTLVSWREVYQLSRKLAFEIKEFGFQPDLIVAVGRGGFVPARILSDFLKINNLTSIKIEHYAMGARRHEVARIKYPLTVNVKNLKVLIVDDVSDSGDTLILATEHVRRLAPREVKTAVLEQKKVSMFKPDFFAQWIIKWRWLIYPWAVVEDFSDFIQRMENRPLSVEGVAERLEKEYDMKVSRKIVSDVLSLLS